MTPIIKAATNVHPPALRIHIFRNQSSCHDAQLQMSISTFLDRFRRKHRGDQPMQRWSQDRLDEVKVYLETKPPEQYAREDWYMAMDYMFQRYLPTDCQKTEAEYQRVRAEKIAIIDANIERMARGNNALQEPAEDDPEFAEWLKVHLSRKKT